MDDARRHVTGREARERALRDWAAQNCGTPLGRVAARILAEDDSGDHQEPEYYAGLRFALETVMNEVL
jgi:hypothetical protein